MTKTYSITVLKGCIETDLYPLVTNVTDAINHRPGIFFADCTEAQVINLQQHEKVVSCELLEDMPIEEDAVSKTVTYNRDYSHRVGINPLESKVKGNWGLIRHQSLINNTTFNTDSSATYTNNYIGTGVDIILNLASIIDRSDPEFMTSGTTRLKEFQWNTLPGMGSALPEDGNLPTVDYAATTINNHAEAVAALTAGNTYGWATGADLYIFPRDQMIAQQKYLTTHGWDAFRLFHQNKGNSRPTIVVDAIQYVDSGRAKPGAVLFRDEIYDRLRPNGIPEVQPNRFRSLWNHQSSLAYGNNYSKPQNGNWNLYSAPANGGITGNAMDIRNLTAANKAAIMSHISDPSKGSRYEWYEAINDMSAAGVHHVSSAGNYSSKLALPDNIDYNTGVIDIFPYEYGTDSAKHHRPGYFTPSCREMPSMSTDTIVCASISPNFNDPEESHLSSKETLSSFSNRGDRVDTAAAGENIYMDLYTNGEYEATGTSFASPNVGGMAALVLGKYPTTTPAQLRQYFRLHAKGNDTLYDSGTEPRPSSNFGDSTYFTDPLSLMGYSGNIAYLDPLITFNPSAISNTSVTSTETVSSDAAKLNFTIDEINSKLSGI
jgi:subtilisin family serine protease